MHPESAQKKSLREQYGRYYTYDCVSSLLVEALPDVAPQRVLDLGSGSGTLSLAAYNRWNEAHIVTVDLNTQAHLDLRCAYGRNVKHSHYCADVLNTNLLEHIKAAKGSFDVALCNPPYTRPIWRNEFRAILDQAELDFSFDEDDRIASEILFVAQNLVLTKIGGHIGLILPDTIISGRNYGAFRKILVNNHLLSRVIQLPRRSFRGTDALAYIVILKKNGASSAKIQLQELSADGQLSEGVYINGSRAYERLDYNYHSKIDTMNSPIDSLTLADLGVQICRGKISSNRILGMPYPVLHTSDFPREKCRSFSVPERLRVPQHACLEEGLVIAEPGDILIARVDRSLERKILTVADGRAVISDTTFRIRAPDENRRSVIEFFHSDLGESFVCALARGVGARFISKAALMSTSLPTMNEDL